MTVKKAIKLLHWWIDQRKQTIEKFKKEQDFKTDSVSEVAEALIKSDETVIYNLEKIKSELVPKCRHPKKMIDTLPDGQKYCMNCNLDL